MKIKHYTLEYAPKRTIRIVQDDCLRFLSSIPDSSIDVIVTDPAYSGMNGHLKLGKGRIVGKYSDKGQKDGKWFKEFQDTEENYKTFLNECKRVLKKDTGHIYIMFDSFSLLSLAPRARKYFDVKNILVWDKVNIGMGHYFRRKHEFIIFATNGNKRKLSNQTFPDIWSVKRIHNSQYPTQKPVGVFDIMLSASAKEKYTICDPFLGSGSAAIAAIKAGCNFMGCDISDKAFKISTKRVENFIINGEDILERKSGTKNVTVK
jgi:site-specific DNA-methyltransferase (adenine-specific)